MDATMWWVVVIAIVQILTIILVLKAEAKVNKTCAEIRNEYNELIDLRVNNAFGSRRRELWWADYDVMKKTLKEHSAEWFKEFAEFRDQTESQLQMIDEQLQAASEEWGAKYEQYLSNMNSAADDIGEIRDRCLELQKANTVLMRTILERMPLPVQPTSPKRKARS